MDPRDVFEGLDAYGCRLALPWHPKPLEPDAKPHLTVRFGAREALPFAFASLQRAVDQAMLWGPGASSPIVIDIGAGFFEGPVIIPAGAPPIVLRGAGADATVIAAPIDAQMSGLEYARRFAPTIAQSGPNSKAAFAKITARSHIGTGNTAVVRVTGGNIEISGVTIRNDYACDRPEAAPIGDIPDAEGRFARGQHQAVALMLDQADRVILRECVLSSFQDTLYLRGAPDTVFRALFEDCQIEGDVDFVFGGATGFFQRCILHTRSERGAPSWVLAPSTSLHQAYGFVLNNCAFTHDGGSRWESGESFLGRQWFEGVRATPYGIPTIEGYSCRLGGVNRFDPPEGVITRQTLEAVGKTLVTGSSYAPHLSRDRLWDDWAAPDWSPRFRPVQWAGADFLTLLDGTLPNILADYEHAIRDQTWLET